MKKKQRIQRKLKKAIKQIVNYYDGCYLALSKGQRVTKWMEKAMDIYNDYYFHYYFPEDNFKPTRKGYIIEDLIHYLYDLTNKQFKANAKWHKKNGEIFVYYKEGNVYPGGKWIPKIKPKDYYSIYTDWQMNNPTVCKEVYSYKECRHIRIAEYHITKEEYENRDEIGAKELFNKYNSLNYGQ